MLYQRKNGSKGRNGRSGSTTIIHIGQEVVIVGEPEGMKLFAPLTTSSPNEIPSSFMQGRRGAGFERFARLMSANFPDGGFEVGALDGDGGECEEIRGVISVGKKDVAVLKKAHRPAIFLPS